MNPSECPVSLHPYFKIRPGQLDVARQLMREFVAKTGTEEKVIHYEFTISGDEVFWREAYVDAEGVLAHLTNVGAELDKMQLLSQLTRLEVHGPVAELDELRGPLGGLNPLWFTYECGFRRSLRQ